MGLTPPRHEVERGLGVRYTYCVMLPIYGNLEKAMSAISGRGRSAIHTAVRVAVSLPPHSMH
jgi:hypothetical protein